MSLSRERLQARKVAKLLITNPENSNFPIPQKGEFAFASGIKSPIKMEFDNLPIGSKTEKLFKDLLYQKVIDSRLDFNCVGGIAKGGFRFSETLAERFNLPHIKLDTKKGSLEIDNIPFGTKLKNCIVFDDVATKAFSFNIASKMLERMLDVETQGLFVIFSYGFIKDSIYSLTNFHNLLNNPSFTNLGFDKLTLQRWHKNVKRTED